MNPKKIEAGKQDLGQDGQPLTWTKVLIKRAWYGGYHEGFTDARETRGDLLLDRNADRQDALSHLHQCGACEGLGIGTYHDDATEEDRYCLCDVCYGSGIVIKGGES